MSKLDGIKAGDRVRVTFEGVIETRYEKSFTSSVDGYDGAIRGFCPPEIDAPTFQITRIEPTFKVGDRVATKGDDTSPIYDVVAILSDGRIVFEYQAGDTTNVCARQPSCFTLA